MSKITDEGALLIKVSRHKNGFDGTICSSPISWNCGAKEYFKKDNCARGLKNCMDMNLFSIDDPYIYKKIEKYYF